MHTQRQMTYFTADGRFGDLEDVVVYDTTAWSVGQWIDIERTPLHRRMEVAIQINKVNEATNKQGENK